MPPSSSQGAIKLEKASMVCPWVVVETVGYSLYELDRVEKCQFIVKSGR